MGRFEHHEYHGIDFEWCWDRAKRAKAKEYWALSDFEVEALHAFLLRVLQIKNDFRRAWRVINHPDVIQRLGYNLQRYIARFLTADPVMLNAMTCRRRSV